MRKQYLFLLGIFCAAVFVVSSCKKDSEPEPEPVSEQTQTVDASDFTQWHYYRFNSSGKLEFVRSRTANKAGDDDMANLTDWDIAFHRENVRTNTGLSGSGRGFEAGVKFSAEPYYDNVTHADTDGYTVDGLIPILTTDDMESSENVPGSKVIKDAKWITFSMSTFKYTVKPNVFLFKFRRTDSTANYAKIYFKGFEKDSKAGFITMQYYYQTKVNETKFSD